MEELWLEDGRLNPNALFGEFLTLLLIIFIVNPFNSSFEDIKSNLNFLNSYHDEYILKLLKELEKRISKLEQFIVTE